MDKINYEGPKPKYQIGDILWVRETFAEVGNFASDGFANSEVVGYKTGEAFFHGLKIPLETEYWNWDKIKWKPSIFMPKEYCRIFLEVTNVRIERLQDISENDAKQEGVLLHERGVKYLNYMDRKHGVTQFIYNRRNAKDSFKTLWELIHGMFSENSWSENPYVFAYDFKIVEKPEGFNK